MSFTQIQQNLLFWPAILYFRIFTVDSSHQRPQKPTYTSSYVNTTIFSISVCHIESATLKLSSDFFSYSPYVDLQNESKKNLIF